MVKIEPLRPGGARAVQKRGAKGTREAPAREARASGVPPNLLPLVDEINLSGEELQRDPTSRVFDRYKRAVSTFLDAAVADGMRVASESSLGLSQKMFSTIARINVALAELADAVLGRQQDLLKTTALVEQVKGLIVDLYR